MIFRSVAQMTFHAYWFRYDFVLLQRQIPATPAEIEARKALTISLIREIANETVGTGPASVKSRAKDQGKDSGKEDFKKLERDDAKELQEDARNFRTDRDRERRLEATSPDTKTMDERGD